MPIIFVLEKAQSTPKVGYVCELSLHHIFE